MLADYDLKIKHISGTSNVVADALSRHIDLMNFEPSPLVQVSPL
jgi:hypothetical protein